MFHDTDAIQAKPYGTIARSMLSFIIVNWNGGEVFKQCVHSIARNVILIKNPDYEIIVIDNNSHDLDEKWILSIPNLKLFKNKKNVGFAAGTNQGVRASKGDCLYFLNNDIILQQGGLESLIQNLEAERVDAVVPKMLYPDGRQQYSIRGFPTLANLLSATFGLHYLFEKLDTWFMRHMDYEKKQLVEQPMFSALMMRRNTWLQVGEMDEKFPLLFNDVDWFHRFKRLRLKCLFVPEATVSHVHGMSMNRHPFRKVFQSITSMMIYFNKHQELKIFETICLYGIAVPMTAVRLLRETLIFVLKKEKIQ
ncbi:MAG: glycosyltransferase family 2 protein [Desulfobacterales bacterium]